MKKFMLQVPSIPQSQYDQLTRANLGAFCTYVKIVVLGDFNADQHIRLYELMENEGLHDLTIPLHMEHSFTWPSDVDWYLQLHRAYFGNDPSYDVRALQRWMDYIFTCGFETEKVDLMGTKPKDGVFMSDHYAVVAYIK